MTGAMTGARTGPRTGPGTSPRTGAAPEPAVTLRLLRDFELRIGDDTIEVAPASQRLLGFLALQAGAVRRSYAGGMLWLDASDSKASACLRSAIWRVPHRGGAPLLETSASHVGLGTHVRVDLYDAIARAHEILDALPGVLLTPGAMASAELLGADLLVGWYDDWVVMERERFRQIRLHALDRLGEHLLEHGSYPAALEVGLTAVDAEPLHETSHRLIVRTHLAEGNLGEALRQYRSYARYLDAELGARPSAAMRALLADALGHSPV